MLNKDTSEILKKAEQKCIQSGSRLTTKRARILELLINSEIPLSAYNIVELYNEVSLQQIQAMSAYRILEFLQTQQLVHKLSLENKFIACSHIACKHDHEVPQFLICRNCHKVKEIGVQKTIIEQLEEQVSNAGYKMMDSQIELECLCKDCLG